MTKKEYILDFLKEINYAYNHPAMYDDLKRLLDEMEEEILENANCKWIPVEERLPETTDYYLVTVGINEYGLMIPSVRTALYNAETKDFTVHTGTNMCIVGNVTAWRDCLPEPYKQEVEG